MAVPTVVTDLSATAASNSPAGGEAIGTNADNYIRALSQFIKELFNTADIWGGTAGGTANALTLTPTPAITAYATGQSFTFKAGGSPSSSTATVAISGLATKAIQLDGSALSGGEIEAGKIYRIVYDGTQFQLGKVGIQSLATYAPLASPTFTGTPAAPTAANGTSTTQLATTAFLAAALKIKVGSFTRDVSTASGNQAVTGVGFEPDLIMVFGGSTGNSWFTFAGASDGSTAGSIQDNGPVNGGSYSVTADLLKFIQSGSDNYVGALNSFDADGFTIGWTKTGSPTGTATIKYIALKLS